MRCTHTENINNPTLICVKRLKKQRRSNIGMKNMNGMFGDVVVEVGGGALEWVGSEELFSSVLLPPANKRLVAKTG